MLPLLSPARRDSRLLAAHADARWQAKNYSGSGDWLDELGSADLTPSGVRFLAHSGTHYVGLPGVNGNFVETPDSAASSPTGDFCLVFYYAANDWTPAAITRWVTKTNAYLVFLNTGGTLAFTHTNSTDSATLTSSVALGGTDGVGQWVLIKCDVDDGGGDVSVTFWTSSDPESTALDSVSWSEVGVAQTYTPGTNDTKDSAAALRLGATAAGASPARGDLYRFAVISGLDETADPDVDLNPNVDTITSTHSTLTSAATSEVWTVTRAAAGFKTSIVEAPKWLIDGTGTIADDGDDNALDVAAAEDLTFCALTRSFATSVGGVAGKVSGSGWALSFTGPATVTATISDGASVNDNHAAGTLGELELLSMVRDTTADTIAGAVDDDLSSGTADTTTGTLENAGAFVFGINVGFGRWEGELYAGLFFKTQWGSLTAAQLAEIKTELTA